MLIFFKSDYCVVECDSYLFCVCDVIVFVRDILGLDLESMWRGVIIRVLSKDIIIGFIESVFFVVEGDVI